jgi:hypothetical protein
MQTSLDRFSPRKGIGKKSGTLLPAYGLVGGGGEGEEGDEKAREKFNSKIHHKLGRSQHAPLLVGWCTGLPSTGKPVRLAEILPKGPCWAIR